MTKRKSLFLEYLISSLFSRRRLLILLYIFFTDCKMMMMMVVMAMVMMMMMVMMMAMAMVMMMIVMTMMRSRHIYFMDPKIIDCMQCLSYDMCSSTLSLKVFLIYDYILSNIVHTAKMEIRDCVNWWLKKVKNNRKSLTVRPKRWSPSPTGSGRLLEVPTVMF